MTLPDQFVIQMKDLLGSEYQDFASALQEQPPVSVRLNPFKSEHELSLMNSVPWCAQGFYLKERPVFTIDPFFHAGHYYVQEASSMFLDYIIKFINLKNNSKVLDLCSAPGGKSTLLLSHMANEGFLHSHEYDPYRMGILKQNIERWGYSNSIITSGPLAQLKRLDIRYDLILVDAPCSGEGMFRKEKDALSQWNLNKVNHCCNLQKNIMSIADTLCAQNGYIVYSTCTWNQKENEDILQSYILSGKYSPIKIENKYEINEYLNHTYTYRMFPHKISGEGFSVSVIKKEISVDSEYSTLKTHSDHGPGIKFNMDYWIENNKRFSSIIFKEKYLALNQNCLDGFYNISHKISTSHMGISIGSFKGEDFYPSHGLSQSVFLNNNLEHLSMNREQALDYLRASTPSIHISTKNQWLVANYKTAKLGWLKSGGSGLKNYFPKNQRIISF